MLFAPDTMRGRDDRARNVASSARKSLDLAVERAAVKAWDHRSRNAAARLCDIVITALVERTFFIETNEILRVKEGNAEQFGHDARTQIFSSGSGEIAVLRPVDLRLRLVENFLDVKIEFELLHDSYKAIPDLCKHLFAAALRPRRLGGTIEQIGHFDVCAVALAGRRYDDVSSLGVGMNDIGNAPHDHAVRHGRSAEFTYLNCHSLPQ